LSVDTVLAKWSVVKATVWFLHIMFIYYESKPKSKGTFFFKKGTFIVNIEKRN